MRMNPNGSVISHLFFADDTLIFLKVDKKNCTNLVQLFCEYCSTSGQAVNLQKCSVFFGVSILTDTSMELGDILGMSTANDPSIYLGVPTIWGRSKRQGLAYMKGRIMGKIQGWKRCTLSHVGNEVVIKVVIQAILAYPMNLFKFLAMVCNELDALISGFW